MRNLVLADFDGYEWEDAYTYNCVRCGLPEEFARDGWEVVEQEPTEFWAHQAGFMAHWRLKRRTTNSK